MKFASKLLQRGVTLFEVLLVLFVGAFIAIAVATIYSTVQTNYKAGVLFNDAQTFAANVHNLYAAAGNYTGLATTPVSYINAGLVPASMMSGAVATNIFGGNWTIATANANTNFMLSLTNIPPSACVSLCSSALAVAVSVTVGATTVNNAGTAVTACTGATNTVNITYS